jgi:hypothetical protein
MHRPRVEPAGDLEPGRRDGRQQRLARAQAQVLGQVGEDEPGLAAR